MEVFRSNSHKSKETQTGLDTVRKIEKVVTGEAKFRKKSGIRKFTDVFLSKDIGDLKSYIFLEVIIPAIRQAVWEVGSNALDTILHGETGHTRKNSATSKVSYRSYYDKSNDRKDSYSSSRPAKGYMQDDIILDNRGEAEEVLSSMAEIVSRYGLVRVADLNELVGITGYHTDNKYGWTDIGSADVVRVRDGYMLKLPKALPID